MPNCTEPDTPNALDIAFEYNGYAVPLDGEGSVNLTVMWEAAGRDESKRPAQWGRQSGDEFIASLAQSLNVGKSHIWKSKRGRHKGAVWAHWQIALAYAQYLSPEFHRVVNAAFREWAQERADPDLKVARAVAAYQRRGHDPDWIVARLRNIAHRKFLTDALKDAGVVDWGYAACTNAIYQEILGQTAKEFKIGRGLPAGARTRDNFDVVQISAVGFAEAMSASRIKDGCAHGNGACCQVCEQAGRVVRQAMDTMGFASKSA